MWSKIINPFFVFCSTWILVIYLISMKLTTNIHQLKIEGLAIIIVNLITSLLLFVCLLPVKGKKQTNGTEPTQGQLVIAYKMANRCFYVFLVLTFIDFLYSGGAPLIWLFTGSDKTYANLGIPSIRGLQYTMYLFSLTIFFYILKYYKFNKWKLKIGIMVLLPFIMLARGLMIYGIFQVFCIAMFGRKIKLKQFRNIAICIVILIMIFGVIGDIRGANANPLGFLVNENIDNPLLKLPSGFTWIYIYITANFNNILLTIGTFKPSYSFFNVFYNLIPGFLKQLFIKTDDLASPLITDASLNVASFYAGYVTSFGIIGAILGGVILQFFSTYYYYKSLSYNIGYLVAYSIMFTCIILSVFFDAFLTVSTFCQLILAVYLARKLKI